MSGEKIRARLRVLATSDLHMHLLPFDYFSQRPALGLGLQGVAALIARHRAECDNCLLMDNGDFLQGNPLGDWLARNPQHPHPMIETMNRLGYDAVTLGNHDFNFGLRFLGQALAGARFPVVTSNARLPLRSSRTLLLHRKIPCDDGVPRPVAIGVIGVMPPQTTEWDAALAMRIEVEDILPAARQAVASLRTQGADLIVALAHSGISAHSNAPFQENAATALAMIDGIDGIISGHTHLVFPGPGHPDDRLIDAKNGRLAGKPAVMPGFWGSHLGVLEYEIELTDSGWRVVKSGDLSQPARYSVSGVLRDASARRVQGLRVMGRPVTPSDRFLLATNDYRLSGPGLYVEIARARAHAPIAEAGLPMREVLHRYAARRRRIAIPTARFFDFTFLGTTTILETGSRAMQHLHELAGFAPEPLGLSDTGLLRIRLHL